MNENNIADANTNFPRVLIVGESFDLIRGSGITLSALFAGWPPDRLACICSPQYPPDESVCKSFYILGSEEVPWRWPFNLLIKPRKAVEFEATKSQKPPVKNPARPAQSVPHTILRKAFSTLTRTFTSEEVFRYVALSQNLRAWCDRFQPTVIFALFSGLEGIRLASAIKVHVKKPMVIMLNDDWLATIYQSGVFAKSLRRELNEELPALFRETNLGIGVSPKMCSEYASRFGVPFSWYCGPFDMRARANTAKTDYTAGAPFRVVYAGRVGRANDGAIRDLCHAVAEIKRKGVDIIFEIYASNPSEVKAETQALPGISWKSPVPFQNVPQLYAKADLLALPLSFDEDSISFARLSMPTKAADYMASAVPILLYCPGELAVAHYAIEQKWALHVGTQSVRKIADALQELINNRNLRENLGRKAYATALANHDGVIVRKKLAQELALVASAKCKIPYLY